MAQSQRNKMELHVYKDMDELEARMKIYDIPFTHLTGNWWGRQAEFYYKFALDKYKEGDEERAYFFFRLTIMHYRKCVETNEIQNDHAYHNKMNGVIMDSNTKAEELKKSLVQRYEERKLKRKAMDNAILPHEQRLQQISLNPVPEQARGHKLKGSFSFPAMSMFKTEEEEGDYLNGLGYPCKRGCNGQSGGCAEMDAGQVFYCGRMETVLCPCSKHGQQNRGGICGPESGCPCKSCKELTILLALSQDYESTMTLSKDKPSPSAPRENSSGEGNNGECVICLVNGKTHLLLPCGHFSYCEACVMKITHCGVCRQKIESRIKVFSG